MEKIHDSITEWTRDEEAKYQAGLITKEVETFKSDSDTMAAAAAAAAQAKSSVLSRPASSRKSSASAERAKKKAAEKTTAAAAAAVAADLKGEVEYITDKFVAQSSLKAWKAEQEKLGLLTDKGKGKPKSPKLSRSPKGNKSPVAAAAEQARGRGSVITTKPSGSRLNSSVSPSKSPTTKRASATRENSPSKVYTLCVFSSLFFR